MIHPIDQQTLQRIIGRDIIPQPVEDEYSIRLSMFHRAGESKELGVIGCIDLVRSLGVMVTPDATKPGEVDWRTVPTNGTVLVKVGPFVGQYYRGYYVGLSVAGTLGVKMIEGDYPHGYVLEVRKDMAQVLPQDAYGNELDEDPAADGRRREKAALEAAEALRVREANEKLRAAKAEAAKIERAGQRTGEVDDQKLAAAQAEIEALKAQLTKATAGPKPIVLARPAPKVQAKKPVKKAGKKPAPKAKAEPANDEPPRDENGEIIYKEFVPAATETEPFRASLDLIKALELETPVFVAVQIEGGEADETEVKDAVYQGIENDLVQVLVDGETEPRVVPATAITLLT